MKNTLGKFIFAGMALISASCFAQIYDRPMYQSQGPQYPAVVQRLDFCTYAAGQMVAAIQNSRGDFRQLSNSQIYQALLQNPERPSRVIVPALREVATQDLLDEKPYRIFDDVKNRCYEQEDGR
ncbi:hypothetical protein M2128_000125 [Polynucleobacter sphagniphilus]|uniref:hypothetical protein n=1 Tax=Polynucleobacter sphagniphilus TaxID=1743169 RepID=UPI00247728E9|nr:hypothetical protein [Polynucleobacter sphagniphilus]MDH6301223.1 hypothetical protein [Polynucleobacter sphagniphilus]